MYFLTGKMTLKRERRQIIQLTTMGQLLILVGFSANQFQFPSFSTEILHFSYFPITTHFSVCFFCESLTTSLVIGKCSAVLTLRLDSREKYNGHSFTHSLTHSSFFLLSIESGQTMAVKSKVCPFSVFFLLISLLHFRRGGEPIPVFFEKC